MQTVNLNYIYAINAWLLINPTWLCVDWSMGCVPVIDTLTDVRVLAVVCLWVTMATLAWSCVRNLHSSEIRSVTVAVSCNLDLDPNSIYNLLSGNVVRVCRQVAMALVWLVVPFLPATNILFRVGFVVAERVLLLPSAGFVMLVAIGVTRISSSKTLLSFRWVSVTELLFK